MGGRNLIVVMIAVLFGNIFFNVNAFSGCVKNPIDIVFLLDGSGSVGQQRFDLVKEFVEKLLLRLNVGQDSTKVALMQFSGKKETKFEFEINDYHDFNSMSAAIRKVKYHYGGLQETGFALKMIGTKVFNGDHVTDRPWARNVVVLITEGPSTFLDIALQEAQRLNESGVHFVAIGVGDRKSSLFRDELKDLASSPQDLFFSEDKDLMKLIEILSERLCLNVTYLVQFTSTPTSSMSLTSSLTTAPTKSSIWKRTTSLFSSNKDEHVPFTKSCIRATAVSTTPSYRVSTITVTSTVLLTSYISVSSSCPVVEKSPQMLLTSSIPSNKIQLPPTKKSRTQDRKDGQRGKHLSCFSCEYNEAVAKEFSVECSQVDCTAGQSYCADAILQHHGARFVKKSCASSQYCNSTREQCVRVFKHSAAFTKCDVDCCDGKLCNRYNLAPFTKVSMLQFLPLAILSLVAHV